MPPVESSRELSLILPLPVPESSATPLLLTIALPRKAAILLLMKAFKISAIPVLSALFLSFSASSCSNYDTNTKNKAATGSLIGAGVGAAVAGKNNRVGGALLGGAIGAAGGAAVGHHQDNN